jgi:hypothetical protein
MPHFEHLSPSFPVISGSIGQAKTGAFEVSVFTSVFTGSATFASCFGASDWQAMRLDIDTSVMIKFFISKILYA